MDSIYKIPRCSNRKYLDDNVCRKLGLRRRRRTYGEYR